MKKTIAQKRRLQGIVSSNAMSKTVVVTVTRAKMHPKYGQQYKVSKRYKAHDERNEYKVGEVVIIEQCRPLSKDKVWRVVKKA